MHEFVSFSCLGNRGALNHGRLFQHTSNIKESLESIWHVSGTYMIFPSVHTALWFPSFLAHRRLAKSNLEVR